MSEKKEICLNCKWWRVIAANPPASEGGYCKRSYPSALSNGKTVWPFTLHRDWCGEFKIRPDDHDTWQSIGDLATGVIQKVRPEGDGAA